MKLFKNNNIMEPYYKKWGDCIASPFFTGPENSIKTELPVIFKTGNGLCGN
jgi:hypothetical protein